MPARLDNIVPRTFQTAPPDLTAVGIPQVTQRQQEIDEMRRRMQRQTFPTAISIDPQVTGPGQMTREGRDVGFEIASEFTPGAVSLGDVRDIGTAVQDPSLLNVGIGLAGVLPVVGEPIQAGLKAIKGATKATDTAKDIAKMTDKEILDELGGGGSLEEQLKAANKKFHSLTGSKDPNAFQQQTKLVEEMQSLDQQIKAVKSPAITSTTRGENLDFSEAAKGLFPDETIQALKEIRPGLKMDFLTKEAFIKRFHDTGDGIHADIKANKILFSEGSRPETLAHEVAHSLIETDHGLRSTPIWQHHIRAADAGDELPRFWGTAEDKLNRFTDDKTDIGNFNMQETQADITGQYIMGTLSPKLTIAVENIGKAFPDSDLGKFVAKRKVSVDPSKMSDQEILEELAYPNRDFFHGTQQPRRFELEEGFEVGRRPDYGDAEGFVDVGSGPDPSSFLGVSFAFTPDIAKKFTGNTSTAGNLNTRVVQGAGEGRVIQARLGVKNPKQFKDDHEIQDFIYGQKSNSQDVEDKIMQEVDFDDEAAEALFERYDNDIAYRTDINREVMDDLSRLDDSDLADSFAHDLAGDARSELESQGFDAIVHKNVVEGGDAIIVFDTSKIDVKQMSDKEILDELNVSQ